MSDIEPIVWRCTRGGCGHTLDDHPDFGSCRWWRASTSCGCQGYRHEPSWTQRVLAKLRRAA